jgi:hypothetical protein
VGCVETSNLAVGMEMSEKDPILNKVTLLFAFVSY